MVKPDSQQRDDLTGLFSRKGFLEQFSKVLLQAKASLKETPLSLALMDVDKFKVINDEYGHVTGDNVLVAVAEVILAHAGKEAVVGRYGGDEFLIVFPSDEREQAFLKLEQIRQAMSQHELVIPNGNAIIGIPISAGVASFPVDGRTENELLRKADHALYRAKLGGRNQVRLAYEERMVPKTTHYTQTQLERLSKLAEERAVNEADLLREAMDDFLTKYGVNDIET
jgi:diguanylate cyclase (GGDEF)-like protein